MQEQSSASAESVAALRHAVATLAYRSAKAIRGAPEAFGDFEASAGSRKPVEIVAHMGDLMDWAASMVAGAPAWHDSTPLAWEAECARYFAALERLDAELGSGNAPGRRVERIFQGPVADALTHTGQLTMLRRMAGSPVRGENYYIAPVEVGRVGADQGMPGKEFD
ncbi:MAG: hypothetical protein R2762_11960 [Bryobacteraceae bacterium]